MNKQEFRIMLSWFMVSDPWPLSESAHRYVEKLLNAEAKRRKYKTWIDAYHKFKEI